MGSKVSSHVGDGELRLSGDAAPQKAISAAAVLSPWGRRIIIRSLAPSMSIVQLGQDATPDEALAVLERDGVVVIADLTSSTTMDRVTEELAPWLELPVTKSPLGNNSFTGHRTLRTSALIAKSDACGVLALQPLVLAVADRVLGPQCARFQLGFSQAIKIGPGERAQAIHRDTTMYPFHRPGSEVFLNTIWALTDFSAANGGTRFYPGSHTWPAERQPSADDDVVPAAMPRGSVVIYYGSCLHGGGGNTTTDQARTGIALGYTLGWLRQEENQYLAVPPDRAETLAPELQRLIGYAEHYPFLGWYEGAVREISTGGTFRKEYATDLRGGESKSVSTILAEGGVSKR